MFVCGNCFQKKDADDASIDHIIPQWVYKNAQHLLPKFRKNLGKNNKMIMCRSCNNKKGGGICVKHEVSLNFWLDLREEINKKINETYGEN